jgi:hypothetical protein
MQNRNKRHSYIDKICVECGKDFQAQRTTRIYCGSACLQSYRLKRIAGIVQSPVNQVKPETFNQVKPDQVNEAPEIKVIMPKPEKSQPNEYYFNVLLQQREILNELKKELALDSIRREYEEKMREIKSRHEDELKTIKDKEREIEITTSIAKMIMPELIPVLIGKK